MRYIKFTWKGKKLKIAKTILKKKNKFEGFTLLDFNTYYKVTTIKTSCYMNKDRRMNQCNRIENPGVNPYIHGQLIFDKDAKMMLY